MTVAKTTAAAATTSTSTKLSTAEHGARALSFVSQIPHLLGGMSVADYRRLPKDARDTFDVLSKLRNAVTQKMGRLDLRGGFAADAPETPPSKVMAELAAIEKRSSWKASTILTEAAKRPFLTKGATEVLAKLGKLLRGGLDRHPEFASLRAIEKAELVQPTAAERQAAREANREAAERYERRLREQAMPTTGYDRNWQDGNRPSASPVSLFVR